MANAIYIQLSFIQRILFFVGLLKYIEMEILFDCIHIAHVTKSIELEAIKFVRACVLPLKSFKLYVECEWKDLLYFVDRNILLMDHKFLNHKR